MANWGLLAARAQAHENATLAEQAYAAGDHARAVEFHKVAAKAYLAGQERTDDEAVRATAPRAPARAVAAPLVPAPGWQPSSLNPRAVPQNLEALQLLAETQRTRALSIMRRSNPEATLDDVLPVPAPRVSRMPSGKALHASKTDLRPPSFGDGGSGDVAHGGSSVLDSAMDTSSESLAPYEPPAMRMWRNAPQRWSDYPFLPAPVQKLFDEIEAKMDLLPNVTSSGGSMSPAAPRVGMGGGAGGGGMQESMMMGQVDTGVGSFMVPPSSQGGGLGGRGGSGDMRQMQEELGALKRSLDASLMVRKEHDDAVGRFRHEATQVLARSRKELDDFFAHSDNKAAPSAGEAALQAPRAGGGGESDALLKEERCATLFRRPFHGLLPVLPGSWRRDALLLLVALH